MPLVADRVAETTTTTGTGTVTLAGAKTGYQAFTTAFSTGAKVYYCITDNTNWEVGVGTFTTVGTTLSRDSVFASSNAGAAVNWGAGTRDVFCTAPMQSIVGAPRLQAKTGAYTVVASDNGSIINCTSGTFTMSLTAAATLGSGFTCWIWNTSNTLTDVVTIDPNASETIDGRITLILRRGEGTQIVCNGTNWETGDKKTMRVYAENYPNTGARPSAVGDQSLAIGGAATANNTGCLSIGSGTTATNNYSSAIGNNSGNAGSQAVAVGAMALGGSYASGTDSFAAAVANNTSTYGATGSNAVAAGYLSLASGNSGIAIGNTASATAAGGSYAIGSGVSATGASSLALGLNSVASASSAFALGDRAASAIGGKYAYASGRFAVDGDAQTGTFVLRVTTTDATASVLRTSSAAASATNQVILPNNSAYAFTGTVVARRQAAGGTESAAWKIEGLIRREGTAASTTLVASTVTAISNAPGWTLALSADTTNGGLKIEATGAAATNIRWVATVQTSEVTYA